MSILTWDSTGERLYETGVKKGVLYPQSNVGDYPLGIAWNGLTAITESPSGAEASPLYADDIKYLSLMSAEEFGATVEAYTYPDEFAVCDGSGALAVGVAVGQQNRKTFGVAYRTTLGNDILGNEYGYKLHIIYGASAKPSEKAYATINDSPEAITLSWELTTIPVVVTGLKPTASVTIDSTTADPTILAALEAILYGVSADARLPLPDEIAALFAGEAPSALSLSTIIPADDAPDIAIDANVVITFDNKILHESIIMTSAAGVLIAGSKSWDVTGKIFTFNPTASLVNATGYIVAIVGVSDIYGQSLAVVIKNFTTVA